MHPIILSFDDIRIHVEEKEDGMDLVFETIRKKNQGDYACKATVRGQEVEKKIALSVFSECSPTYARAQYTRSLFQEIGRF